ncbi:glycoside hydrolase family 125 protein, partial [Ascoidea rubescens DSM 1968]
KKLSQLTSSCEDYLDYSQEIHPPLSNGNLKLPFQRPLKECRTFASTAVEKVILDLLPKFKNQDLARLFENAFPNTLDTTILYHKNVQPFETFVVTGDIHAQWLRDSTRQLSVYQPLLKYDSLLKKLVKGAINTQANYILASPYCNAFHPPINSGVKRQPSTIDTVFPVPNWKHVFECKYELDSLTSFLTLTTEYFQSTNDYSFVNDNWIDAFENILTVLKRESSPTFDSNGNLLPFYYTFQRQTKSSSETLPLHGTGNPVNFNTNLIRSAFRPSDDSTIFQFLIPSNAHLSVELLKISKILTKFEILKKHADICEKIALNIKNSIYNFAVFNHSSVDNDDNNQVFAYEIDGYGSALFIDDANLPSLLSLPDMGFLDKNDQIYLNTRDLILRNSGNPYYLKGKYFEGIGGPHIGLNNAWPMSLCVRIRTTDNDEEILRNLDLLLSTTGGLGLIHESIDVNSKNGLIYTRSWFAWANSEFAKTILDLAERKPHLIFKDEYSSTLYSIHDS